VAGVYGAEAETQLVKPLGMGWQELGEMPPDEWKDAIPDQLPIFWRMEAIKVETLF